MALEQFAQARVGTEIARLHDQEIGEVLCEQRLERRHIELGSGGDPHDALFGEHRDGPKRDLEPRGVLGEIAIVEANDLGLPLPPSREDLGQRAGALGHQPGVGPVNEHGAAIGLWRLDEARDG